MKGGTSIEVLLDLALGNDVAIAKQAADSFENTSLSL